jgi:Zn-dependent protease with chaperone function
MPLPHTRSKKLIQKLEVLARKNPNKYKLRLHLLIGLGYSYLFSFVVLLCAYVYHIYSIFNQRAYLLVLFYLIFLVLICNPLFNAFFVKIFPPHGVDLDLENRDNERLTKTLKDLSKTIGSPEIDRILITIDLNATVLQIPRFGLFGKSQNILTIGLPLMLTLNSEQFNAILAHELAHLSSNELSLNNWIYRLVRTLNYAFSDKMKAGKSDLFFDAVFGWYLSLLDTYSFVSRRKNEYEADRLAADRAGAKNIASALVSLEIYHQFLDEKFWSNIHTARELTPEPPNDIFELMEKAIVTEYNSGDIDRWLKHSLNKQTNFDDTHPCLLDRLSALGYKGRAIQHLTADLVPSDDRNSARAYIANLALLITKVNTIWSHDEAYNWKKRFIQLQKSQQSANRLVDKSQNAELTVDELWRLAIRRMELGARDEAINMLYQILENNPTHAKTNLSLGTILLENNDTSGIEYLETAMKIDTDTIIEAVRVINLFAEKVSDPNESSKCREIISNYYIHGLENRRKYPKFNSRDLNNKHKISVAPIKHIQQELVAIPEIKHLYAFTKSRTDDLLEHYILVTYSFKDMQSIIESENLEIFCAELVRILEPIGLSTILFFQQDSYYECDPTIESLRAIPGTCIYNRKKVLAAISASNQAEIY